MSSFLGCAPDFDKLTSKMKVISRLNSDGKSVFEVFLGERMGKKFAIKTLKKDFKDDPVYSLMLHKEFEIGAQLSHPGIVKTIGMEEIEGIGIAIVEEFIPGKSLSSLLQSGELKIINTIEIFRELIENVAYLHSSQIVHNDIKPSNIIISDFDGKPKLIDFGFSDSPGYSSMKFKGGTTEYIAPERKNGEFTDDPRSDIWSLGVLAEKLVSFTKGSARKKLLKIARRSKHPIEERPRDVKELLTILNKRSLNGNRLFFWFLLLIAASVLIFFRNKFREESKVESEPNVEIPGNIEEITETPQQQISEENTKEITQEKPNPVNEIEEISGDELKVDIKPDPTGTKTESGVEQNQMDIAIADTENELYRVLALNYAQRLTAEMIAKRKEEGKFHQPETRDQLLESRYEYERLMKDIKDYVEMLDIPPSAKGELTEEAQKAATDLIHEEAAKRDAK